MSDWRELARQRRELRELLELRRHESLSRAQKRKWQRPEYREANSRHMRLAWQRGVFENRRVGCSKATAEKIQRAVTLRARGWFYYQIARQLGVSVYTASRWCGWERKGKVYKSRHGPSFKYGP